MIATICRFNVFVFGCCAAVFHFNPSTPLAPSHLLLHVGRCSLDVYADIGLSSVRLNMICNVPSSGQGPVEGGSLYLQRPLMLVMPHMFTVCSAARNLVKRISASTASTSPSTKASSGTSTVCCKCTNRKLTGFMRRDDWI